MKDKVYIVIEYCYSMCNAEICSARRFTEEESEAYAEWFREQGFVGFGDCLELEHIRWDDMPKRDPDGMFPGTNNNVWIITPEDRTAYIAINDQRAEEKATTARVKEIERLRKRIAKMEQQCELPTRADARRRMKEYNDFMNEGGEGYVPYIYSMEDYEYAKEELSKLENEGQT